MQLTQTQELGTAFEISPFGELRRYLMLGTDSTFYNTVDEQQLALEKVLRASLTIDAVAVVDMIVECRALAPKPETTIKALAFVLSMGVPQEVATYAWSKLDDVVRTGSHMLTFAATINERRGWGRAVQRNIGSWYTRRQTLAYQLTKYQGRTVDGQRWTQADVLALAFGVTKGGKLSSTPKFALPNENVKEILQWAHGDVDLRMENTTEDADYLRAFQAVPSMDEAQLIEAIHTYRMPWEIIPTDKRTAAVWEALLPYMGGTAFYRSLATMTANGVASSALIAKAQTAREHPLNVLTAWYMYRQGHGLRGSLTWNVNNAVTQALEEAFYRSFQYTSATNVPQLIALDVSSSMTWSNFNGVTGLNPRTVSAVLAMTTMRAETTKPDVVAFSHTLVDFPITAEDTLETVIRNMERIRFGGTDTSLPLQMILNENREYGGYTVYTDGQTRDRMTPQLLTRVRERMPLRMVEVAMVPNNFTFAATSNDLQMTGFTSDMPAIINTFLTM